MLYITLYNDAGKELLDAVPYYDEDDMGIMVKNRDKLDDVDDYVLSDIFLGSSFFRVGKYQPDYNNKDLQEFRRTGKISYIDKGRYSELYKKASQKDRERLYKYIYFMNEINTPSDYNTDGFNYESDDNIINREYKKFLISLGYTEVQAVKIMLLNNTIISDPKRGHSSSKICPLSS